MGAGVVGVPLRLPHSEVRRGRERIDVLTAPEPPANILYVQELATHLNSNLLYKMGHYFVDTQYHYF